MSNLERAYAADVRIRIADEHYPSEGVTVIADEFATEGVVYENDGVRVTAFEVDHGDQIKPAYWWEGVVIGIDGDYLTVRWPRGPGTMRAAGWARPARIARQTKPCRDRRTGEATARTHQPHCRPVHGRQPDRIDAETAEPISIHVDHRPARLALRQLSPGWRGSLLIANGRAGIGLGSPRRSGIPATMRVITNAGPGVKHDIQRALNVRNLNLSPTGRRIYRRSTHRRRRKFSMVRIG